MATYTYDPSYWKSFDEGNGREWVITAGNGAYGGGSLIGGRNRAHQAYLIASLNPPTERYAVLEQITEYVSVGGKDYDIESLVRRGQSRADGWKYLRRVRYDGTVKFEYELRGDAARSGAGDGSSAGDRLGYGSCIGEGRARPVLPECESGTGMMDISKHIALLRDENTVVIDYRIVNYTADEAEVYLTPEFNFREHNTLTGRDDLKFRTLLTGDTLSLVPDSKDDIRIDFSVSEGTYLELRDIYDEDIELQTETELEADDTLCTFRPYDILIRVSPGESKHVSAVCTVAAPGHEHSAAAGDALLEASTDRFVAAGTAAKLIRSVQEYYRGIEDAAHKAFPSMVDDEFYDRLVLAADHFIVSRRSTGLKSVLAGLPWFTDWGRDTMIAFAGLTLCTGRYDDAREILKSFALYERNGLIPNMFPDSGAEPLYNTADASLWYFVAVYHYLKFLPGDPNGFIRKEIYPVLTRILEAYEHGTDNSIYMEKSGLIHAGSGLDQVTWMDVRVGDLVVTPRHGCPVEINALWYNALSIGAMLAARFGDEDRHVHWQELADRVGSVYEKTFMCIRHGIPEQADEATGEAVYLYDVVDGDEELTDDSVRPNMIFAVSLPFSPLSEEVKRRVVDTAEAVLYAGTGLRSLAPGHPDYHGQYRGALMKRDLSYHQGTSWGYLIGPYIDAYRHVHASDPDISERVAGLFDPIRRHMYTENCIGGICEVFEGDPPHAGKGCYTQAWSVGEVMRSYLFFIIHA